MDNYLLLLSVLAPAFRRQFVLQVMERAMQRVHQQPRQALTELAMEELERALAEWFGDVLQPAQQDGAGALSVRGRVALLLADVPNRWPEQLLRPGPWPEDFVTALRQASLCASPERRLTLMTPHSLDFGWGAKLARLAGQPRFKATAVWILVVVILGWIWLFVL